MEGRLKTKPTASVTATSNPNDRSQFPDDSTYKAVVRERIVRKKRTRCSVCGREFNWAELEPGTGRCPDDMP